MFNDDDSIVIYGSIAAIAVAYWWLTRQNNTPVDAQSTDSSNSTFELPAYIGDTLSTIQNKLWTPPTAAKPYLSAIENAENRYGLPSNLLGRLLYEESHYRTDIISGKTKSSVGALGIAQFMPATAKEFGVNPLDPFQSIDAAGKYLKQLYSRFGSWDKALAAYNWGQGNVSKKGLANAPTETKNYFNQILSDIGLA